MNKLIIDKERKSDHLQKEKCKCCDEKCCSIKEHNSCDSKKQYQFLYWN